MFVLMHTPHLNIQIHIPSITLDHHMLSAHMVVLAFEGRELILIIRMP